MDNARPFAGIEVVEFGQFIAVPFCAQLLSEGGAHVVKVESVDGDPVRQLAPLAPGETRPFLSRNPGTHSLPLALRPPDASSTVSWPARTSCSRTSAPVWRPSWVWTGRAWRRVIRASSSATRARSVGAGP